MYAFFESIFWLFSKLTYTLCKPMTIYYIFKKSHKVPPITNPILLEKASELVKKIRNKQIKCTDVVKAYIERIRSVNPIVNAVINERFSEALFEAEKVDKLVETATEEELDAFPLLGVPVTVKGSISVAGLPNTSGLVGKIVAEERDARSLSFVRKAGAIPLLTSNVPELCLNWETRNRLVGVTKHPFNTCRSPGGSSGGEAALITSAASVFGLGSDVVGSLRLPSHFCGIFAHKPTPGVISTHGHYPGCSETRQWIGIFTIGPLARFASDLMLGFRVMVEPEEKKLLKLDKPVNVEGLKVYYLKNCNQVLGTRWSKAVRRTFKDVLRHLDEICSNKCKELKLPLFKHAAVLNFVHGLHIDGVDNLPEIQGRGQGWAGLLFKYFTCRSKYEFTSILYNVARRLLRFLPKSFIKRVFTDLETLQDQLENILDENTVIILPTFHSTAVYHHMLKTNIFDAALLGIFNSLGFPVTNCPVGVDEKGFPIGIQIVSGKYNDRLSLRLAEELEKLRGGWRTCSKANNLLIDSI